MTIDQSHPALAGLRLPVRRRIAETLAFAAREGRVNRRDICAFGEISMQQAAKDLAEIRRRLPGALVFDAHAKTFRFQEVRHEQR